MDAGKKSFLWLVALFVAPILLGTLLFFNMDKLGLGGKSVNYGTLVQPALPLKTLELSSQNKPAVKEEVLSKKWTMAFISQDDCDQICINRLKLIERVRLLTNEQMRRVRTVFVTAKGSNAEKIVNDDKQFKSIVKVNIENELSSFLQQFPERQLKPIYLIDPLGNLMMYYPQAELDIKAMLKDINRLLKYSHLG